jgi:hypothetical protein
MKIISHFITLFFLIVAFKSHEENNYDRYGYNGRWCGVLGRIGGYCNNRDNLRFNQYDYHQVPIYYVNENRYTDYGRYKW